jgi:hypothetical protein
MSSALAQAAPLQRLENFEIAAGVSGGQRRGAVGIGQVGVGTMGQQRSDDINMTVRYGKDQGPVPFRIERVHIDVAGEGALDPSDVAVLGGTPKSFRRRS